MTIKNTLLVLQIVFSVLLVVLIAIQPKGKGLSKSIGQGASVFTRRGLEKIIYRLTFISAAFFVILSILQLFVQ